jgi:hypothetical protein
MVCLIAILRSLTRRQHGSLWNNVHTSAAGRAPNPAVAFDDGLLPIDSNWSYFEKLALVPRTGPYLTGPDFRN